MTPLDCDKKALACLCRRHRVRRLSLFGSVLKGIARPDSGIDYEVVWQPSTEELPRLLVQLRVLEQFRTGRSLVFVAPAKAGVQGRRTSFALDSRLRGNDDPS